MPTEKGLMTMDALTPYQRESHQRFEITLHPFSALARTGAYRSRTRENAENLIPLLPRRSGRGWRGITSDFAILDVKKGRKALAKHFENRPRLGKCPKAMRIPVVIQGYIDSVHSGDDGTSQEFAVVVEKLELMPLSSASTP